jgi:hypothetical protein
MLLNEAEALYLGSTPVNKAYLGTELVWPSIVGVFISRNYVYEDAVAATLVGTLTTQGGTAPYTYLLLEV